MSRTKIYLTTAQISESVNCFRVAAERFAEHGQEFAKVARYIRAGNHYPMFAEGEVGAVAADRLAEQFGQQAQQARQLAELFEPADGVTVFSTNEAEE